MSTVTTRLRAAVAVLIAAAAPALTAGPAAAAAPGYSHVENTVPVTAGYTGAYVSCPSGELAVASGSVVGDPEGMLLAGSTTTAGTGSFAATQARSGWMMQTRAQCVAADRLRGSTLASTTLRDQTGATWGSYNRRATCPEGTVAYGGGGNVIDRNGYYDAYSLYTYGTRPEGRSWLYAGAGNLADRPLLVEAHCVPRARLGHIVDVEQTVTSPNVYGRQRISAAARCPSGYFAFAGGAWFHTAGSSVPGWYGYLMANIMSGDDRGWVAYADAFNPSTQLTARVRCTDRLG